MAITSTATSGYNVPSNAGQSSLSNSVQMTNSAGIAQQLPVILTSSIVNLSTLLPGTVYPTGVKFLYLIPDGSHDLYLGGSSSSNATVLDGTAPIHGPFSLKASPQVFIGANTGTTSTITVVMI